MSELFRPSSALSAEAKLNLIVLFCHRWCCFSLGKKVGQTRPKQTVGLV